MASKIYVSAVPLTMVRTVAGGYQNVLEGDQIAGEAVNPEDLKRLVRKKFLVEKKDEEKAKSAASSTPNPDTVEGILKEVGDDKAKAKAALDAERAKETPRSSLVDKLQAVLDKA